MRVKTVLKVLEILKNIKVPATVFEIRKRSKNSLNHYSIKKALEFLEQMGKVQRIQTSFTTFWQVEGDGKIDSTTESMD